MSMSKWLHSFFSLTKNCLPQFPESVLLTGGRVEGDRVGNEVDLNSFAGWGWAPENLKPAASEDTRRERGRERFSRDLSVR